MRYLAGEDGRLECPALAPIEEEEGGEEDFGRR
jgi:hypothetical protein